MTSEEIKVYWDKHDDLRGREEMKAVRQLIAKTEKTYEFHSLAFMDDSKEWHFKQLKFTHTCVAIMIMQRGCWLYSVSGNESKIFGCFIGHSGPECDYVLLLYLVPDKETGIIPPVDLSIYRAP